MQEIGPGAEGGSTSQEDRVIFGGLIRDNGLGVGRHCLGALSSGVQDKKRGILFFLLATTGEDGRREIPHPSLWSPPPGEEKSCKDASGSVASQKTSNGLCRGGPAPKQHLRRFLVLAMPTASLYVIISSRINRNRLDEEGSGTEEDKMDSRQG